MANDKEEKENTDEETSKKDQTVELTVEELSKEILESENTEELLNKFLEELVSSKEEIEKLNEDLESQKDQTNEYISYSQRLQADFDNFRRNCEKQKQDTIKFANEQLILNLLDSYEDLGRAIDNSSTYDELKEGVELINKKLNDTLKKEGLAVIPTEGEKLDPFKHEALLVEDDKDVENGYIIEELMKGYTLKDKVIKTSKVKVCKK